MAGQEPAAPPPDRSTGPGRLAFDKSQSAPRSGSVGMVLLVALTLIAAAAGLLYVEPTYAGTYILTLLALLGTTGVCALFAMASGIMQLSNRGERNPLLKAVVDNAFDAIVITDQAGRVFYANATYLELIGATNNSDVRPIERVFIGDPDVSESIYRLLRAAREGRRLQEEVRIAGATATAARWLRMRVRPLGESKHDVRMTVWSIADVTRDRERQENVFQELQHAIDYLDHAPAGFFSVDATGGRNEVLRRVLANVANELRDKGALDEAECFIDATFVIAKGGGAEIGATKRGKGMKIMAIVDRHGLPLSVSTHAANHHEVRLVQLCFDFYMIEAKPENLIGDRAYDSDPLDEALRQDGIEMIAPHRCNRSKPPTQDRRRLSRYMRRWLVERFFAWIQWQRRILVRWEYHTQNFLGFVQLACLVILFRRF